MGQGKVSNLRESYGFIKADDGEDLFFIPPYVLEPHKFSMLKRGDVVEFERVQKPGDAPKPGEPPKFRAINIRVVKQA